jgi:molybdate transport system ATP-binding protein
LIELRDVDVALNGTVVLRGLNWSLRRGEHWMVAGRNGSGKSTFLRLLRGEVWPAPNRGERIYRLDGTTQMTAIEVRRHVALVSPEIQERYLREDWRMTGRDVIETGFAQSDMLYVPLTRGQKQEVNRLAAQFGIVPLLSRDMQTLSTGELRKVLIARAVVGKPALLLLDEVCDGLDAAFRSELLLMLEMIGRNGTQIIYTTHRADEPLSIITHAAELSEGQLSKSERLNSPLVPMPRVMQPRTSKRKEFQGVRSGKPLIRISKADVFLDRIKVLHGIDWELHPGEHWVVLGRNGAGKSTFLKLVASDLYPAFGARVSRFEITARHTIWDLRRRIGCVSPLLQAQYREAMTGEEVVASGFASTIGFIEKPRKGELRKAAALLDEFELGHLRRKSTSAMSFGEVRKVLTLRALVHRPELLILDEPFDGLDSVARRDFAASLERIASRGTQLLIVTHHLADLPSCITHGLLLENGRITVKGLRSQIRAHERVVGLFGVQTGHEWA